MPERILLFDVAQLREDLAELRRRDPQFEVFGASDHRYTLNEPLSETQIARFEKRHAVTLPADYRQVLLEIGNGGAGPYYGVFKLGEMDDGWTTRRWKQGDGFIGDLSAPFPHTRRWNKRPRLPKLDEDDPEYEKALEDYDRQYWDSRNVNGAIPICHLGCCLRHWLVITGKEAGHVWVDERTDDAGVFPLTKISKRRFTFREWYCRWLSNSLREAPRRRKK